MAYPGTAAPQCGNCDHGIDDNRSGEQQSQVQPRGWYSRGYIPHFDSAHVIQHITYRLADSLPSSVLAQILADLKEKIRNKDAQQTELRRRIETYLDAGHGSCVLRVSENAACIEDTWHRFDGERYHLLEWVVMPNHCHVLIEPFEGIPLGKIVLSWKNYTARWINERISRTGVRRSQEESSSGIRRTQVWHREYWDRFIRDESHLAVVRNYITMNPVKAGLVTHPEEWPWSSAKDRAAEST
ncbi:MAG: REP-associated tyrosine transposase [Anaerolineae bacterium]